MTNVAFKLKNHPKIKEIVQMLISHAVNYPGVVHLICFFGFCLNDTSIFVKFIDDFSSDEKADFLSVIIEDDFWYFWIIFFATKCDFNLQQSTSFLIFMMIKNNKNLSNIIDSISNFLLIVFSIMPDFDIVSFAYCILNNLLSYNINNSKIIFIPYVKILFFSLSNIFHDYLIKEFLKSSFSDSIIGLENKVEDVNIDNIEILINELKNPSFHFHINFKNEKYFNLYLLITENIKFDDFNIYKDFIHYSTQLGDHSNAFAENKKNLFLYCNEQLPKIVNNMNEKYLKSINAMIKELSEILQSIKKYQPNNMENVFPNVPIEILMISPIPNHPSKKFIENFISHINKINPKIYKRERDSNYFLYPCKYYLYNEDSKISEILYKYLNNSKDAKDFIFSSQIILIKFSSHEVCQSILWKQKFKIYISSKKTISIKIADILFVLPKTIEKENDYIEIYTKNKGSFLISFSKMKIDEVLKYFIELNKDLVMNPQDIFDKYFSNNIKSNFDYLLCMNILNGKSFHYSGIYPSIPHFYDQKNYYELSLDYFMFPEIVELSIEEIYKNRKELEKIDIQSYSQIKFKNYFENPINLKQKSSPILSKKFISLDLAKNSIIKADFLGSKYLFVILSSKFVQFFKIKGSTIKLYSSYIIPDFTEKFEVFHNNNGVLFISDEFTCSFMTPKCSLIIPNKIDNFLVSLTDKNIYYCYQECSFKSASIDNNFNETILFKSTEKISCFSISEKFDVCAYGTETCMIYVHSLTNNNLCAIIDLDKREPEKILISESFGFIIVEVQNEINVFTLNGTFIAKSQLKFDIKTWKIFANKGIDYVIFINSINEMGIFEAIEPNNIIYNDKQFKKDCNVFCTNFNDIMQCITTLSINDYIYTITPFEP